ncbi:aldose 1-epimerase [Tenacibaculum finnmarkense]|uniref:aldose epimerase family protein n=1 Tax=Tenacibaculum finnmarkense TaxID=2781243 RepID=UPI00187B99E0|nr:aldose 1-epimerase [Tenacibaculum finnmarkense]MBE7659491.1 aldose 1-epimerase [Tenacibaculum finnmarkense genomovar finnmarkense]MCG8250945.1 aldose 1-epimerase [Tenacibaculum finnmarkense genomovar finnmarkense]MCG8814793.1 aldose 1-epimerase [Tenacibaculum finnmarkense]MCG8819765.1 aldose 1-epimerase [Tenacibaculum finnmarkense]
MSASILLKNSHSLATIYKGELISFIINNEELIHSKDSPGWNASDIEMFPIIGPTKLNNFSVDTPNGIAKQDQHGLLRELNYKLISSDKTSAVFEKKYVKNTLIKNSKFPEKSTQEHLFWTYDFIFRKIISLEKSAIKIAFEIISDKKMPYMFGYHPSFKLSGFADEIIKTKNKEISISEILNVGSAAYKVLNTNEINLIKKEGSSIKISSKNFDNFMLWTPVKNMVCIEPITQYPLAEAAENSIKNSRISSGNDFFSVTISTLSI